MLSRRARLLVLVTASLVASLALVVATWPRTLGTYQGCAVDAECVVVGPACEQVAIAGDQREGYEAAVRCRCGPCGFALAADSSAEAWRAWAGAALEQRTLCPLALGPPMSKICRTGSARCGRELGRCFLRP